MATQALWVGFSCLIVILLAIDSYVLSIPKYSAHNSTRHALLWTLVWVIGALLFNFTLWRYLLVTSTPEFADTQALNFLSGYLIEKSLAADNLFVFYLIFTQFKIPPPHQQRVLAYGIWGAVVLRLLLILLGVWLVTYFHWIFYVMGAFLVIAGIQMAFADQKEKDLLSSRLFKNLKRIFRITDIQEDNHFFVRKNTLLYATPLFIALIFIEFSDIIFALESIPAIFAITTDPFIVWTSNIFAILGLRALYFVLIGTIRRFTLLKYAIALILVFVGFKMLIMPWLMISASVSLGVITSILFIFSCLNYLKNRST
jgi:TerC family integral membrane protein